MCGSYATGKREEGGRGAPKRRANQARGDCAAERGRRGGATLRHGCAWDGAGRSGRTEPRATARAERSRKREGALHPPPDSDRRERRGGGTGGGGRGQGLRAGAMATTTRLRAQRTRQTAEARKFPRAHGARGLDGRAPRFSERRGAWRPVASRHHKYAPSLWRVERTRGCSQRTPDSQARSGAERAARLLIRKRGAERSAQRIHEGDLKM